MSSRERNIDVQHSGRSVIADEYGNIRDHFEAEMARVQDEMNRLRREFESYTPRMFQHGGPPHPAITGGSASHHNTQASSHRSVVHHEGATKRYDPYFDAIQSPLIKDESDGKKLRLRFNVNQYLPEEVTVKTVDNRLLVHAKHEEKSPQKTVFREYNQEFMLPRGTNPEVITSSLSTDGVLTVEAPLPAIEGGQADQRHITYK